MKMIELKNKLGELIIPKKWEPIGTIKMFDREQNMSKMYYGTWELTLKERSPVGVNPNSTEDRFKTAGQQFGEKEHRLTLNELPSGTALARSTLENEWSMGIWNVHGSGWGTCLQGQNGTPIGNQAHNNIHPVETIYFYKRIA